MGLRSVLRFIPLALCLLLTTEAAAQTKLPFNFVFSKWTENNGLPQNSVNDIIQTRDGYIWVATFGGLARFDGTKFTVFDKFNSPGLASNRILTLFQDRDGGLWIGTERGLSYYKNGSFKTFSKKDGFSMYDNVRVFQDKKGVIWLFAYPVFYQFHDGRFYKQKIINDETLRREAYAGEADFFVPFRNKIYAVIDGKVINFFTNRKFRQSNFRSVIQHPEGTIWATTNSVGLYKIQENGVSRYTSKDGLLSNSLQVVYCDKQGVIWVTGSKGLNYVLGNKIHSITDKRGMPDAQYGAIIQDGEGNYWLGTQTSGVVQMRRTIITTYGPKEGLKNDELLSLCFRDDGSLLIGTNGGGIYELRNKKIIYSPLNKIIKHRFIWFIFEDSRKRIWCFNQDLCYINEKGKLVYPREKKFDLYNTRVVYEDRAGNIWIGYRFGLLRYHDNHFTRFSTAQGLSDNYVRCIFEDNKGNIWAGTVDGLNEISNGKIKSYTSIPGLRSQSFRAIYQDQDGVLWFGTYGGGLVRLKDGKFFVFTTENGLHQNVVSTIVEDRRGYFWLGGNRGIQRVSRQELDNYADGKTPSYFVYNYGKSDGMVSAETNGGFQPSAVKDRDGNIYFPTVKGLVVVHTRELHINHEVPPVYIEKVLAGGKARSLDDLRIPYDSSNVEIQFCVLSFTAPRKVRSKYIMEGYDKGWNDAGDRRYASYTNLPPGTYTFRVIASNADNIWNEKGAAITITILPPFWMTWWFRSILILLFLAIGPTIYYRRVKALKHEQELQHEFSGRLISSQEMERSRIAQELHDSLGQELLLIKNRAMLGLKYFAGDSKTKQQLEYISEHARNSIDQVRSISHNLRPPELDRLGLTETLRTMIGEIKDSGVVKIESDVRDIDGLMEKEKEINLLRIIQEAVVNIMKHSGADKIAVKVLNVQDTVSVSIEDNGKGFDAESDPDITTKGLGFRGMKERATILEGDLLINSTPGKGTTIELDIPLKHAI